MPDFIISNALKDRLKKFEDEIATLESQNSEYESQMADPDVYEDSAKSAQILTQYNANKARLDTAYEDWSEVTDQLATAESSS